MTNFALTTYYPPVLALAVTDSRGNRSAIVYQLKGVLALAALWLLTGIGLFALLPLDLRAAIATAGQLVDGLHGLLLWLDVGWTVFWLLYTELV